jgi:antitoxin CptB
MSSSPLLDERALSKLKWRCRRGLLENDLFLARFFAGHETGLTVEQATGLEILMDLSDNDLMDLFLARKEPEAELDRPDVRQVLSMVRATKADSHI